MQSIFLLTGVFFFLFHLCCFLVWVTKMHK